VTEAELARALATGTGASYVIREPIGRERIARALQAGSAGVAAGLPDAAAVLAPEQLHHLRDAVAKVYGESRNLARCSRAARVLDACQANAGVAVLETSLSVALEDEVAAETLEAEDRAALLRHAAVGNATPEAVAPVLRLAELQAEELARDRAIPDGYLALLVRWALSTAERDPEITLRSVLAGRPRLLDDFQLTTEERDRCLSMLEGLDGSALEHMLDGMLLAVSHPGAASRLAQILARLPMLTSARLVARQARAAGRAVPPTLSELCDDFAANVLCDEFGAPLPLGGANVALAAELLSASRSHRNPAAFRILVALSGRAQGHALELASQARTIDHPRLQQCLLRLATDRATGQVRTFEDVSAVWEELSRQLVAASSQVVLLNLLAAARRSPTIACNELILLWIARLLLPQERELLSATGRLRPPELQTLSFELARYVAPDNMEWRLEELAESERRIRAWWTGLASHSRSEWRRARRPGRLARALHRD